MGGLTKGRAPPPRSRLPDQADHEKLLDRARSEKDRQEIEKDARRHCRLSQETHALDMDGLTSRKLFVDSRLRQSGGKSYDFVLELPEAIHFPAGTRPLQRGSDPSFAEYRG
jgi:hypothetical protein